MSNGERDEQAYLQGQQMLARKLLSDLLLYLPATDSDRESWKLERADIVMRLRDLCERHGDNDWSDNMDLGDVIEKHLQRYLDRERLDQI